MHKKQTFRHGYFTTTIEPMPAGVDPRAFLEQAMHDCPECRAALARGEQPVFGTGEDLMRAAGVAGAPTRAADRFRRPRWRDLKKRVRR